MDGDSESSAVIVNVSTTLRDAVASNFGAKDATALQTFTDPPPPYDIQAAVPAESELGVGFAAGQNELEGSHGDRVRTRIYDSLFQESNSNTPRDQNAQGIIYMMNHPDFDHSNGWYDNCFTRSCVCDYTGRHVIPEYITSGSLYRGRVLGWKIFREIVLPLVNDVFRIILQLIGSILLLSFSLYNYASGRKEIYNIVHLSLSALALLLASIDLGALIVQKIMKCQHSSNRHYTRLNDEGSDHDNIQMAPAAASENGTSDNGYNSPQRRRFGHNIDLWAKFSNVDIARLIIPELLLFPIVICDVYMLINDSVYRLSSALDGTSFIELLLSISLLVVEVYMIRLVLLVIMTYRVHTKRSVPQQLSLNQEAIVSAGYDPTVRRNGLIYLSFLIFNVVTHMINQIAMILAIGVKIHNFVTPTPTSPPTPCRYYWDCNYNNNHYDYNAGPDPNKLPFQFWFMIAAGYILPIVGAWLFFSVTHFWLQEFAIGVAIDYLSILKLPGADRLFFPNCTPYEAQEKTNKILLYNKYGMLRQDYYALRSENPLAKAWYPFKSVSHTFICLVYTAVQVIFVYAAAFSIHGEQLNLAVFLFVIITELLSNVYILLVSLFWIMVAALFFALILLVLGVSIKCIICIAIFCNDVFNSSRGPPQPPVMTPQIRMGLQQV